MSGGVVAVLAVALAVWVAMPEPRQQLRRLESRPPGMAAWVHASVSGKQGAPALRMRVLLAIVAVGLVLLLLPPGPASATVAVTVVAVVLVGGGRVSWTRESPDTTSGEFANTVELLAVCLEAGSPMRHALEVVADVGGTGTAPVMERVSGQLAMGVAEPQAWLELAEDDTWGPVARDIARSARSGTSLVEVLRVHADEARLQAQEHALQRARATGVRSVVPLMACFLPAFVLVGVLPIIAGLLGGLLSP